MFISKKDMGDKKKYNELKSVFFELGNFFGFRTWNIENHIDTNDDNQNQINIEKLLAIYEEAANEASQIDCIWLNGTGLISAIIEITQGIGITISLSRMKNFKDKFPPFPTRYVIVAPDEDRKKVLQECGKEQFRDLNPLYFPYSSVEELYSLCQRRNLKGVTEDFLDCFMEKTA